MEKKHDLGAAVFLIKMWTSGVNTLVFYLTFDDTSLVGFTTQAKQANHNSAMAGDWTECERRIRPDLLLFQAEVRGR